MDPLDTIDVDTEAGVYTIKVYYDEESSCEERGDRYGYNIHAPNGEIVGSLWAIDGEVDYIEESAGAEIDYDASDRVNQANTVGAGFVGII